MCGIGGIVDWEVPPDPGTLDALRRALRHRGPDGEGAWSERGVGLVHTRLAIVPAAGPQPRQSPDGRFVLVYNGEIYDVPRLRAGLPWEFETEGDTEALLAALVLRGEAALPDLDGMFAFFLWDRERQVGLAARDRLGVKPLVFARTPRGGLRFASEAKALVAAFGRAALDEEAFAEWMAMPPWSGVDRTPLAGIDVLPPGCLLRVSREGVAVERWGGFVPGSGRPLPEDELLSETRIRLRKAVTATAHVDGGLAVLLSGGLDSTTVAAIAGSARPDLQARTVAFQGQASYDYARSLITIGDDTPYAVLAARELGLAHEIVPVPRDAILSDVAAIAAIDDRLPAWEQQIAQHRLFASVAPARVALVGDAADETWFGYPFLLDDAAIASPRGALARFGAERRLAVLDPGLRDGAAERLAGQAVTLAGEDGFRWDDPAERPLAATSLIVRRWLPRLLHDGDIHAMAHGVECRVPFASAGLLDLAARVPFLLGFRDGREKALLRRAAPPSVPEAIRWRPKSALPKDQGIERHYRDAVRGLGDLGPWFDRATVAALVARPEPLDEIERAVLFQILAFTHWRRTYLR